MWTTFSLSWCTCNMCRTFNLMVWIIKEFYCFFLFLMYIMHMIFYFYRKWVEDLKQPSSPTVKRFEEKGISVIHEVKCKLCYAKFHVPNFAHYQEKVLKGFEVFHASLKTILLVIKKRFWKVLKYSMPRWRQCILN